MCVCTFLTRTSWRLLLVVFALSVPSVARSMNEDFDYYNDDVFDRDWINNYDPLENPPCPDWNPFDGCGRTPARTKPASTTATPYEQTTPTPQVHTTRHSSGGRQECSEEETKEAACLHGGECFAIDLLETRSAHCHCMDMWRGNRCEEMDEDIYVITADKVEKASIAAGVVVLIIVITVIIVYLAVRKRKQRKNRAQSNGNANGHAGKALMGSEKEPVDNEDAEKCTDV